MKSKLVLIIIFIGIISTSVSTQIIVIKAESNPLINNFKSPEGIKAKLYSDVFVSLLFWNTQKAVTDFYTPYLKEIPGADPNFDEVLSVERVGAENRLEYLIKIKTMPYIGPHNSVGTDHITFHINALGEVTLEKFEHIESSSIIPELYPDIIIKWPPK